MTNKYLTDNYGWKNKKPCESYSYLGPLIISILKKLKVKRVLDLGSGNGSFANALYQEGFYVVGIDGDKNGVNLSKKAFPWIKFINLDIEKEQQKIILSKLGKFDAIVSLEVIEHLYSPHKLIKLSDQLLLKKGSLIISTPFHGYLKNLLISILDGWDFHFTSLWHGGHIKFWSKKTITMLLVNNKFKVISFNGAGRLPFLWKSMVITAVKDNS
jgi:2-polyprenyl-3-methyl-5-hydroxy-6-metoxy-1,4-benzoquinol methylase